MIGLWWEIRNCQLSNPPCQPLTRSVVRTPLMAIRNAEVSNPLNGTEKSVDVDVSEIISVHTNCGVANILEQCKSKNELAHVEHFFSSFDYLWGTLVANSFFFI